MASHRIGARVAGLSPAQLCAIIEAQAGASDAALRVAEEHAARLVEQPEWVLSEVLLSPDLAPHILAQLPTKEHAAKGTCRAWRRGWKETLKKRGHDNGEFVSSVERYDPAVDAWEAVAPMAEARFYPTAAVRRGRPEARPQPRLPQLGRAVRSGDECVGGGGADGGGTDSCRRGGARRQAVRCGRLQR
uniref:F-box domain-containing protein n=1 Tax=Emiliania huxleyi TaxID=2903 RepID=A0A6V2Y4Z9_EMIHU